MSGVPWLLAMADHDSSRFSSRIFDGNGLLSTLPLSRKRPVFERLAIRTSINAYKDSTISELKLFDTTALSYIICILPYIRELMVVSGIMVSDSPTLM